MKFFLLIFLFFISSLGLSQTLPTKIDIELYVGGDYRTENIKGFYNNKERLKFQYFPKKKSFICELIYKENKILVFKKDDGSLIKENINLDSTLTILLI